MPIRRAKSVDELYDAVRGYDLVLAREPSLTSALNRRLDDPHFGPFAITPRRLATGRVDGAEDRSAFLHVVEATDLGFKAAAQAVGDVLQCWEERGDLEAILAYDRYDTPATRAVVDCLRDLGTTSAGLDGYRIPEDRDVAVVGLESFTALERSILPDDYTAVDPLADESTDLEPFRLFDSPAAIVDTVVDSVTAENADRVAIVLDRGGQFSPLVEAALEAAGIPFYGGPGFADDPDHRAFLGLLRAAHAGSGLRVADVRPVLRRLGADVAIDHDEKRVDALDVPAVRRLRELCDTIDGGTLGGALSAFEAAADADLEALRAELETLGLADAPATEAAVDRLDFYFATYEVPVDREDAGVVLADATAAATVDRPAVFYLGMAEGWTHDPPRRPWVDRDAAFDRDLRQFQRLLQNGVRQYYLVLDERAGRSVTPCLYFEAALDASFDRFADAPGAEPFGRSFRSAERGFDHEPLDVTPERVEAISQSALNRLVNCPRDQLFSRLVDGPDRDYFAVGNRFHDFAEVYVDHPDAIDDDAIESVVDLMIETTRPFDRDVDAAVHRTRYRIGLETIAAYLDEHPPEGAGFLAGDPGWGSNDVADHLGLDVDSTVTERWFDDADLGLRGKIDLVHSPTALLDYKSGRHQDSATQVVAKAALDPPHDTPDYQAIAYLTYLRSLNPASALTFTFFHFLATLDDVVTDEADLADCLTTITYHPVSFDEYVAREAQFDALREDGPNDCRKTFEGVSYAAYAAALDAHPFPEGSTKADLLDSPLGADLLARARDAVGDYAYVENGVAQALSQLAGRRDGHFFADDLDAFESFVADRIEALNRYRAGERRFPVAGLGGEPNWRRVDHRDMILEGDD